MPSHSARSWQQPIVPLGKVTRNGPKRRFFRWPVASPAYTEVSEECHSHFPTSHPHTRFERVATIRDVKISLIFTNWEKCSIFVRVQKNNYHCFHPSLQNPMSKFYPPTSCASARLQNPYFSLFSASRQAHPYSNKVNAGHLNNFKFSTAIKKKKHQLLQPPISNSRI